MEYSLFVTCPAGIENILSQELEQLGASELSETVTGVICQAPLEAIYRICLWSRYANRVILLLARGDSGDRERIYRSVVSLPWQAHIGAKNSFKVDFSGANEHIRHTQFGARVVKDAIVDHFREADLPRPDVELDSPDIRINVRLTKKRIYIGLDLSGDSLHKRGYRAGSGLAPIKENLAAALLYRADWPSYSDRSLPLVDPMCGSGTFLIEAALFALGIAPGLYREHFGFEHWLNHDSKLWEQVRTEADTSRQKAISNENCMIFGCEITASICEQARENIERAGLAKHIRLFNTGLKTASFDVDLPSAGLLICNPPYGMRMGEADQLSMDYQSLADVSKARFPGWTLGILSSNPDLLAETRLRFDKKYRIFNGPIPCEFRLYSLKTPEEQLTVNKIERAPDLHELSAGAMMVANRLDKNLRKLKRWREQGGIECFRAYDADLPEYAAAVDVYRDAIHVQEYQAPKSIDVSAAKTRLGELVSAVAKVFSCAPEKIFVKTRKINRGNAQYEKIRDIDERDFFEVHEAKARVLVNLKSYLDTGLFLDHRPLRLQIGAEAKGVRFLNLFCYTAVATVHAVLGGAKTSTSVDMSNTYIDWAKKNFALNNIRSDAHKVVRENAIEWLNQCREGFDLIMLDPPSFSNSKKMRESFDVQRDHVKVIKRCMDLLSPKGKLYFSNNLKSFKISEEILDVFSVSDITQSTIDLDFSRNKKIHHCFLIQHSISRA